MVQETYGLTYLQASFKHCLTGAFPCIDSVYIQPCKMDYVFDSSLIRQSGVTDDWLNHLNSKHTVTALLQ